MSIVTALIRILSGHVSLMWIRTWTWRGFKPQSITFFIWKLKPEYKPSVLWPYELDKRFQSGTLPVYHRSTNYTPVWNWDTKSQVLTNFRHQNSYKYAAITFGRFGFYRANCHSLSLNADLHLGSGPSSIRSKNWYALLFLGSTIRIGPTGLRTNPSTG